MILRFRFIRITRSFMSNFCNLYSPSLFSIREKLKENRLKGNRLLRKRDSMLKERREKLQNKSNKSLKVKRWKFKPSRKLQGQL